MNSFATDRFWKAFDALPADVQEKARAAYRLWQEDPYHDTLYFKRVHAKRDIYSVRIGRDWRALGVVRDADITWFWIGSHSDYDKLLNSL